MNVDELVEKYLLGESLSPREKSFLRSQLTREMIENAAVRGSRENGQSRRLFKLANLLFATPHDTKPGKGSSNRITMFGRVNSSGQTVGPRRVSGGGVNGTGKRGK